MPEQKLNGRWFASVMRCRLSAAVLLSASNCIAQTAPAVVQDCADCPAMVVIPAGTFMMGDADDAAATPVHQVRLNYRFAIGKTEVTEAQFGVFLRRTGYQAGADRSQEMRASDQPAVMVDWYAANAYALWLSRHTGKRYRLPSEAEWEYAARAGKSTRYWWGDSAVDGCGKEHVDALFFPAGASCAGLAKQDTIAVAGLRANPWGLYDMLGNAAEWMLDCPPVELPTYAGAPADGSPFMGCSAFSFRRVVRGPGFLDSAAPRRLVEPTERSTKTGFRVVRELP